MDYDFDDYGAGGAETLTFVDDDDGMSAATQDSQYYAGNQFSLPTQSSQVDSVLVSGVESNADLTFQEVDESETEEEYIDTSKFVEHACRYCGISDPLCVAKCTVCDKWFCNSKQGTSGSHIVNHMVRSRHREAFLHEESPCGPTQLECYLCASKNVFNLGFIPAKADSVVVILCRTVCLQQASQKDPNWVAEDWKTLITERQLLSWLVNIPSEEQDARARKITQSQASRLEDLWREMPNATLEDLDKPGIDREPDHVTLRYDDAFQYKHIFKPLIKIEAEYDKIMKESQTQNVGLVRWDSGLKRKSLLAYFHLPKYSDGCMKLMIGDQLKLTHNQTVDGSTWSTSGTVFKLPDNLSDEVGIEVKAANVEKDVTEKRIMFTCEIVWNSTTFDRQYQALDKLANDNKCVSQYIFHKIMGRQVDEVMFKYQLPKRLSVPGLPDLNPSQMQAIKQALTKPLSLIQGPPGTGKTVTSATMVYHLVNQTEGQVLVCSPSNIAVDHLAEKIHKTGLKVVRLTAKSRDSTDNSVRFLTIESQLRVLGGEELKNLIKLKEEIGELEDADHLRYLHLKQLTEHDILAKADVICSTCSTAADPRLARIRIKTVLIDESTQATEPEIMVSIVRGVRHLILVGDHCQLGPVVSCKKAANAGLQQSLFERLILLGIRPHRLQVQYRMHPVLSAFPSNAFYEGSLQNGVSESDRILQGVDWQWPVSNRPSFFWSCYGAEEMSSSGTSFLNRTEAANVEKLASKLIRGGMLPEQIGIITPYEGQRAFIVNYMHTQGSLNSKLYENVQIASVDAFQGREKDFIIVTCVRSNSSSGIGFLNDPRRLNVAITRAKYGLVVIGNAKVLGRQPMWHDLITFYKDKGLVFEGPINNLKSVNLTLPKPVAKTSGIGSGRYGLQRFTYNYNEFRGTSNARLPMTYNGTQNLLSQSRLARDSMNSNIPVPLDVICPNIYVQPKQQHRGRRNNQESSRYSEMSQSQFSQASQDPHMHLQSGTYDASLSAWSQSQSGAGSSRFTGHTQPMSQDMSQIDDVEQDLANLLLSQGQ
ncbi:unnamed protein product [Caenorhabditis angaria]|uniref:DNA helicase n=1 Tax=Caenorhabditis angaria TaxID=860376 RepID=A0A9P1I0R8_9PELO|nr:unnamed protein product [Caenorhabditis angaria]